MSQSTVNFCLWLSYKLLSFAKNTEVTNPRDNNDDEIERDDDDDDDDDDGAILTSRMGQYESWDKQLLQKHTPPCFH